MSTFVLVHGAWHGGWCWHKIVARLEAKGHTVLTPDMVGHGLDRTPPEETTLKSLADSIAVVVEAQEEKVVLVGHSFGGTVVGEVAERCPEKIRTLVYLAAFVPPNGKGTSEVSRDDSEALLTKHLIVAPDRRSVRVDPKGLSESLYAQCSDEDLALARVLLVAEGSAALLTPSSISPERWGSIPHVYIECLRDKAIGIAKQRELVKTLIRPKLYSFDTDHSPFFSVPDALTACLTGL
jgi:pimeloyl-ACP methyl ester carboxylesterase